MALLRPAAAHATDGSGCRQVTLTGTPAITLLKVLHDVMPKATGRLVFQALACDYQGIGAGHLCHDCVDGKDGSGRACEPCAALAPRAPVSCTLTQAADNGAALPLTSRRLLGRTHQVLSQIETEEDRAMGGRFTRAIGAGSCELIDGRAHCTYCLAAPGASPTP